MPHNKYNLLQTFPNASHQTLTHLCPPFQHFLSERLTSFGIMGTSGAPLKPLSDDSALRALSSLRGLRGAPEVPPLCRETQSLGQQMLNATVGINGAQTPHHWDGFPFTTNGIRTCWQFSFLHIHQPEFRLVPKENWNGQHDHISCDLARNGNRLPECNFYSGSAHSCPRGLRLSAPRWPR